MYEYRGVEYISRPLEYELGTGRGVLYLHDTTTGISVLRMCRIPDAIVDTMLSGTASIDLASVVPRSEGIIVGGGTAKIAPVFIEVGDNSFSVVKETGELLFEVRGVPQNILDTLRAYGFADITLGYTER